MTNLFLLFTIFAIGLGNLISAENVVSLLVGLLTTLGVTQFLKNWTGLAGFGATLLALIISFLTGLISVVIQMAISGEFSGEKLAAYAVSIFTTATLAYQALRKDNA
ncbi:MAG TPA: hypothetical protein PKY59_12615 [Pyrinomonadaceae bacterium]|nr:hypothetical protein [Pyrinomonadaceae bacterium]